MYATDVIDSRCIEIVKEVYEKLPDFGSKVSNFWSFAKIISGRR